MLDFLYIFVTSILGFKDEYELYKTDETAISITKQASKDYYKAKYDKKSKIYKKGDK
jgi:hypothetical protein